MYIHRVALTLLSAMLVVLLAACGGAASNPSPTPTTETPPTRTPRPTAAANPAATAAPTTATEPTAAAGGATERPPVTNTDIDVTALGNVQVEMKIDGLLKTEGQADEPIKLSFLEIWLQNGDRSLTIESDSPDTGVSRIIYLQIGAQAYQYVESGSDRNCLNITGSDMFTGSILTPDSLIGDLQDARLAERGVRVNGFTTDRYTFNLTEQALGYQGQANGEIWVSSNPAVVVRHVGELTGTITGDALDESGAPLPGALSNLRWEYNVTKLTGNTTLTLPEVCEQLQATGADIPLPPNISNQMRMGELISFETTDSAATMATFFQTEMVANGWQAGETSQYGDTYQLTFSKDGRTATVMISTDNNKTSVIILLASS
ncbi:hypothetical protein A6A03_13695 [Chloroflexus islandicus]|uniref:Uncharacterized protein n=1 Tax=Chloroflexus islandicus TaxID=1707952 RepID=A0A178MDH0_9CHLR|nr:hypothetical protein [Chloroflexus islandicus]OAN45904.1 hypothetical protein A6A03_13695 [Chloroflexus islandicus]